jgi:hypothetical protein
VYDKWTERETLDPVLALSRRGESASHSHPRDRETERQRDRETERQRDRETERQESGGDVARGVLVWRGTSQRGIRMSNTVRSQAFVAFMLLWSSTGCVGSRVLERGALPARDEGVALFRVKLNGTPEAVLHVDAQADRKLFWNLQDGQIDVKEGDGLYALPLEAGMYEIAWVTVGDARDDLAAETPCTTFEVQKGYKNFVGTLTLTVEPPHYWMSCTGLDADSPAVEALLTQTYPEMNEKYPSRQTSFASPLARPSFEPESAPASDEGMRFHVLLSFGGQIGGEPLVKTRVIDGSTSLLRAGNALSISGGGVLEPYRRPTHALQLQGTVGYNYTATWADNGGGELTRVPVELLAFYFHRPTGLRIGGGAQYQLRHSFRGTGALGGTYPFDNALGMVVQADWLFGRFASVYARYTFIGYSMPSSSASISGNAFGFGMSFYLPGVE